MPKKPSSLPPANPAAAVSREEARTPAASTTNPAKARSLETRTLCSSVVMPNIAWMEEARDLMTEVAVHTRMTPPAARGVLSGEPGTSESGSIRPRLPPSVRIPGSAELTPLIA